MIKKIDQNDYDKCGRKYWFVVGNVHFNFIIHCNICAYLYKGIIWL
jgi:hypothetical protein